MKWALFLVCALASTACTGDDGGDMDGTWVAVHVFADGLECGGDDGLVATPVAVDVSSGTATVHLINGRTMKLGWVWHPSMPAPEIPGVTIAYGELVVDGGVTYESQGLVWHLMEASLWPGELPTHDPDPPEFYGDPNTDRARLIWHITGPSDCYIDALLVRLTQ